MTRANRHAEKQKQEVHDSVPHTLDPATPYGKPVCTEVPKMNDKEFDEIIQLAIQTYGKEAQTRMLFEEMAELQNALCKLSRGRGTVSDVCEEIADVMYGIIDIKMRMLKIPELKKIMGFPEDYVLIGTQADQKKFIGNAVEVTIARAWCEALCCELEKHLKKEIV